MEWAGYISSIAIGVSLGLVGSGGSILTVPVLVYLFSVDAVVATGYSLFIVGITSALGSVNYFTKGLVNMRTAVVFGIPSVVAVFATRAWLLPAIPDILFASGSIMVTKRLFLLLLFALLMIGASYSMIRSKIRMRVRNPAQRRFNYAGIVLEGVLVGTLTGLVGAGGGFLIIPALVLLSGLPMKEAVGTSLVIIAAKSLIGFLGEGGDGVRIDWSFLLLISLLATAGIFVGAALSRKIDGEKLKPVFGVFILVMGVYIILRETLFA